MSESVDLGPLKRVGLTVRRTVVRDDWERVGELEWNPPAGNVTSYAVQVAVTATAHGNSVGGVRLRIADTNTATEDERVVGHVESLTLPWLVVGTGPARIIVEARRRSGGGGLMVLGFAGMAAIVDYMPDAPTWYSMPTVLGDPLVDETLTYNPGVWDDGVSVSRQWVRLSESFTGGTVAGFDGQITPISEASSLLLTESMADWHIAIEETGQTSPGTLVTVLSRSVGPVVWEQVETPVPVVRVGGNGGSHGGNTSAVLNLPLVSPGDDSPQVGDYAFYVNATDSAVALTDPAGWTQIDSETVFSAFGTTARCYYKELTSADITAGTVESKCYSAIVEVYRGVNGPPTLGDWQSAAGVFELDPEGMLVAEDGSIASSLLVVQHERTVNHPANMTLGASSVNHAAVHKRTPVIAWAESDAGVFDPDPWSIVTSGGSTGLATRSVVWAPLGGQAPPVDTSVQITSHPQDTTAVAGTTATFTVTAANVAAYRWQVLYPGQNPANNSNWEDILESGADTASFTTSPREVVRDDGKRYRVRLTGTDGQTVFSNHALLTVVYSAPGTPEDILFGPIDFTPLPTGSLSRSEMESLTGPLQSWTGSASTYLSIASDPVHGRVLEQRLVPTSSLGTQGSPVVEFRRGSGSVDVFSRNHLFLRYLLWFDPSFDWGGNAEGGKLPGLAGGSSPTGGGVRTDGFSMRLMWRTSGRIVVYAYFAEQENTYGDDLYDANWYAPRGQWIEVVQEVKCNTSAGASDGIVRLWMDGDLVTEETGMRLRTDGGTTVDQLMYSVFHGGTNTSSNNWAPSRTNYIRTTGYVIGESLDAVRNPTGGDDGSGEGTSTGGSGGALTDQTFVSFTDSSGTTSDYHLYAADLDWTKKVGILIYTDGSNEFGLKNPGSSYLLAGSGGMIDVAKSHNMILLTPMAPGDGCTDGGGECWYLGSYDGTSISQKLQWSRELVDHIYDLYDISLDRVAFGGYSSGAQWTTQYFGPAHARDVMVDGVAVAISYGGVPLVTDTRDSAHKAAVPYVWDCGTADPAYSTGTYGAIGGYNHYTSNGFITQAHWIDGEDHSRSGQFAGIMDREITEHVPPPE